MKIFGMLALFIAFVIGGALLNQTALARPDAKVTLGVNETQTVSRNGCTLAVMKNTAALVKIRCNPITTVGGEAGAAQSTLNPGQRLKILANGCELRVVKNKPGKVKVKCLPIPTETVTVGPGGAWSFDAKTVNILVGQTVKWTWASDDHTVTSGDGTPDNLFCSPNNKNCATAASSNMGFEYRVTFGTAGTFDYYCRIHDGMTGTVNVSAP